MTIVIPNGPNKGETELLNKILIYSNEDFVLKLFKNDIDPGLSVSLGDLTEATFTGYTAKSLERTNWNAAIKVGPITPCTNSEALATYNTELSWICSSNGTKIYGYYVVGETSLKLLWLERYETPRLLNSGDSLRLTPRFQFRTQIACT